MNYFNKFLTDYFITLSEYTLLGKIATFLLWGVLLHFFSYLESLIK